MVRSYSIIAGIFLVLSGSVVFGQPVSTAAASKIVVVNTAAFFDEKAGITAIVAAARKVDSDLAQKRSELQQLVARIDPLEKELLAFRENAGRGVPVNAATVQAKVDELDRLRREGKFKQDEFNALAQKTQNQVVGPVYAGAMKALGEFIKSKGYGLVFDVSKDQDGLLIYATEQYDITKDFIAFYNARPPTAITSVPK